MESLGIVSLFKQEEQQCLWREWGIGVRVKLYKFLYLSSSGLDQRYTLPPGVPHQEYWNLERVSGQVFIFILLRFRPKVHSTTRSTTRSTGKGVRAGRGVPMHCCRLHKYSFVLWQDNASSDRLPKGGLWFSKIPGKDTLLYLVVGRDKLNFRPGCHKTPTGVLRPRVLRHSWWYVQV